MDAAKALHNILGGEGNKAKAAGPGGLAVVHEDDLFHSAMLREVVLEHLGRGVGRQATHEDLLGLQRLGPGVSKKKKKKKREREREREVKKHKRREKKKKGGRKKKKLKW